MPPFWTNRFEILASISTPCALTRLRLLTAPGSGKESFHLEVSLTGSDLRYEAGDSLGVFPSNDSAAVDAVRAAAGLSGAEPVESAGTNLREVLTRQVTPPEPSRQLLAAPLEKCPEAAELSELIDPKAKSVMDDWIDGREAVDILPPYPRARFSAGELVKVLACCTASTRMSPTHTGRFSVADREQDLSGTLSVEHPRLLRRAVDRRGIGGAVLALLARGTEGDFVHLIGERVGQAWGKTLQTLVTAPGGA